MGAVGLLHDKLVFSEGACDGIRHRASRRSDGARCRMWRRPDRSPDLPTAPGVIDHRRGRPCSTTHPHRGSAVRRRPPPVRRQIFRCCAVHRRPASHRRSRGSSARSQARSSRLLALVLKDHTKEGFLAYLTPRFMDWVGNARHGVQRCPTTTWTHSRWMSALRSLGLTVQFLERSTGTVSAPGPMAV